MNDKPRVFAINEQQLTVLANFLAKLPWEQANPHIHMLSSLKLADAPAWTGPKAVEAPKREPLTTEAQENQS